jgi:rRNA small subunit pseudouridine methyltransferase Nep1
MATEARPVYLILAESAVELVPKHLRGHASVISNAERAGRDVNRTLLDSSFHHRAMRALPDSQRRGRPDITHFCALLAQGSRMNAAGRLRLFIHTFDDQVITIAPETRLPRVYDRFKGLIEQVLVEGAVPKDERLLAMEEAGLKELLAQLEPSRVILFTPSGKRKKLRAVFPPKKKVDGTAVLIGAFSHGDFKPETAALSTESVSIADAPLEAWSVEAEVLHRLAEIDGQD